MPFYTRNGQPVTADEAVDETGCIRAGYSIHHSILHMDSAPSPAGTTRIFVNDSGSPMTLNDAMSQIPSEFRVKILQTEGSLLSDTAFVVDNGIYNMRSIVGRLENLRAGYGGGFGMVTDSDKTTLTHVIDYCNGLIAGAQARKPSLRR